MIRRERNRCWETLRTAARPLLFLNVGLLACSIAAAARTGGLAAPLSQQGAANAAPSASAPPSEAQLQDQQATGSVVGTVVDQSGAPVFGARVTLTRQGITAAFVVDSDQSGQFSLANVPPGPFQLSIVATDFETKTISGVLHPGEFHELPAIALALAPVVTQVVVKPQSVIAREQVKQEEKQRVLGVFPNFYVTYLPNAAPLDARQKYQLAWKSTVDPVIFGVVAAVAGIEQADGQYSGFGTGAEGYAKRYGASYADVAIGTFLGSAVLPSVFKQDPRFFYREHGSVRSRSFYALAAAAICKGDNGRWQPNYSNILGNLGAGAISNLYYPPQNRNGAALTFESAAIGIGATAAANLLQEFILPKFTSRSSQSPHH